jgi:hypothetical protein
MMVLSEGFSIPPGGGNAFSEIRMWETQHFRVTLSF